VSLAILSVGLVGAVRVFPVGLRASQRSERSSRAAIAAQRTIECLKLTPWDELVEGAEAGPCDALRDEEGPSEEADYTVTTRITEPEVEALVDPTRLKMIEVSVEWLQDARSRRQSFVTYLRRSD